MSQPGRMTLALRIVTLCAAMVFAVAGAHAQGADSRLDRASAKSVNALLDSARQESLPVKPLTGVMQEGISRHADGPRIVKAMQGYLRALRSSVAALGSVSSEEEIVSGAGAELAGVPPAALAKIRAARGKGSVVVPLVVLGDLVARGLPVDAAGSAVVTAAKSGFHDAELLVFRQRVEQDIAAGSAASAALESGLRRLQARPALGDTTVKARVRQPDFFDENSHLDLRQMTGPFERSLVDLSGAGGLISLGGAPIDVNSNFHLIDVTRGREGALFEGGAVGRLGTRSGGAAAGVGVQSIRTTLGSWTRPSALVKAWTSVAGLSLTLNASISEVPSAFLAADALASGAQPSLQVLKPMKPMFSVDTQIPPPPSSTNGSTHVDSSSAGNGSTGVKDLTASDVSVSLGRNLFGMQFLGAVGVRLTASRGPVTWTTASLSKPLIDGVGVTIGGSAGPEDYLSRGGGTRFFAGLRLAPRRADPVRLPTRAAESASAFRATPSLGGTILELRTGGAKIVEVTGDFSNWEPVVMRRSGSGLWSAIVPLTQGIHRVRIRIDDGEWTPPPGLPRAPDPFGGEVGLLRIEQ